MEGGEPHRAGPAPSRTFRDEGSPGAQRGVSRSLSGRERRTLRAYSLPWHKGTNQLPVTPEGEPNESRRLRGPRGERLSPLGLGVHPGGFPEEAAVLRDPGGSGGLEGVPQLRDCINAPGRAAGTGHLPLGLTAGGLVPEKGVGPAITPSPLQTTD